MRIDVIGPLRLEGDDGREREIPERKVRLLLLALVACRGTALTPDGLVDRVWGDDPPANPLRTLRAKISLLRSLLDEASPGARERIVTTDDGGYLFDAGRAGGVRGADGSVGAVVDADRFADLAGRARQADEPADRAGLWARALALWRGRPFADAADDVRFAPEVAELDEQRLTAVEERAEALLAAGRPQTALDEAGPATTAHPSRERLAGAAMLALYRLGRQNEALHLFATVRSTLADDLGADPGPALRDLHERILRQDDDLAPAPVGTVAQGRRPGTNLPAEVSPLIGREAESAEVAALVDGARLVTLTGPGGVGKTRLALDVARAGLDRHPRGVWFVDLAALEPGDGGRVAELAALALGMPSPDGADTARLAAALDAGSSLLVLDNCEHVVDDVASFVAELLAGAAPVRVLTTSREPLGLADEQRYAVPRMRAGDGADPGPAVALFAARAMAVTDDFVLDETTTGAVAELCGRLDGLPLAMELAAARLRVLTVAELTERLTDRLNLLARPGRGVPRRQQTLRGMLDWSWSLLDEPLRVLLRRLSVHRGGFTLAAAEACAGDLGGVDVLDALADLVDRSLVDRAVVAGAVRFHLLEVVAVYAAERLDAAGERDEVAGRHLDHLLDVARRADALLRGSGQRDAVRVLDAERENLRIARAEALRRFDGDRAVGLAMATFWYQWITGRWRRLGGEFAEALALPGTGERLRARAVVLRTALELPDDPASAVARADRAVADAAALDATGLAEVRWFLGSALAAVAGPGGAERRDGAVRHLRASADEFARTGDGWHLAITITMWTWWSTVHGGPRPDRPPGCAPLELLDRLGDRWGIAQALSVEYRDAELAGRVDRSAALAARALELCDDLALRDEVVHWTVVSALAAVRDGDDERAAGLLGEARALATEIAYTDGLRFADLVASVRDRCRGELAAARRAMDGRPGSGPPPDDVLATVEDGFLAVAEGDRDRAGSAHAAVRAAGLLTGAGAARLSELGAGVGRRAARRRRRGPRGGRGTVGDPGRAGRRTHRTADPAHGTGVTLTPPVRRVGARA